MPELMIEIRELKFQYPGSSFQLDIDAFDVSVGERVAIVGPSGSGKTTLLNLISGIQVPSEGRIRVGDVNVDSLPDFERRVFRISSIGMVFQQFELIEYLSVLENILLPFFINPSLKLTREVRQRARELAQSMGLGDKLQRNSKRLSQGEQQRVAVSRALLNRPSMILADEPTGNLDPRNKSRILEVIFDYCQQENATLLVVTHDSAILDGFDRTVDFEKFFGGLPS